MKDLTPKIYTSYFYQIRNFKPYIIPISTAKWDPKWYHNFGSQTNIFLDKNGVMNGLRAESFAPGAECDNLCNGKESCASSGNFENCKFLKAYESQIFKIDINLVLQKLRLFSARWQLKNETNIEPIYCFIVHEAPTNLCSERGVIQKYFKANGIVCDEFDAQKFKYVLPRKVDYTFLLEK